MLFTGEYCALAIQKHLIEEIRGFLRHRNFIKTYSLILSSGPMETFHNWWASGPERTFLVNQDR